MIDLSDAGIFWVVSDDKFQQKLLSWSIHLAKRHYPELPRCVATSDPTLQVDADIVLFRPTTSPKLESIYQLIKSPFKRTLYLCCRSMILSRFEHLLSEVPFEGVIQILQEKELHWDHTVRATSGVISYTQEGAEQWEEWRHANQETWNEHYQEHILTQFHKQTNYVGNKRLIIDSGLPADYWMKKWKIATRKRLCNIPFPLWFRFPVLDLAFEYETFYDLVINGENFDDSTQWNQSFDS